VVTYCNLFLKQTHIFLLCVWLQFISGTLNIFNYCLSLCMVGTYVTIYNAIISFYFVFVSISALLLSRYDSNLSIKFTFIVSNTVYM